MKIANATAKYAKGDLNGWFFELKQIKMIMIAKIPPTKRTELKTAETRIVNIMALARSHPKNNRNSLSDAIENYNEQIQILLDRIGISIPSRESRHLLFGQKKEDMRPDPEEEFTGM